MKKETKKLIAAGIVMAAVARGEAYLRRRELRLMVQQRTLTVKM